MKYAVKLYLVMPDGKINESSFDADNVIVGDQFLTFSFGEGDKVTRNFPYDKILQFDVEMVENESTRM